MPSSIPRGVVPATNLHMQMMADRMRADEREHQLAFSGASEYDPEVAARAMMISDGIRIAYLDDEGMPIMVAGWCVERGQCWRGWMVNSDEGWRDHWRGITKVTRWFIRQMFDAGATRLQLTTLASRHEACDWYERGLGFELDGILRGAGAHGEDLVIYSRLPAPRG